MAEERENPESTESTSSQKEAKPDDKESSSKYDDKRSFSEELDQHKHNVIWAFDYGEEVAKKTAENVHAYQKKFLAKYLALDTKIPVPNSPVEAEPQPCTSKHIIDQKTPHSERQTEATNFKKNKSSDIEPWTSEKSRAIPLPDLPWADNVEVWQTMVYKEEATSRTRNCRLFENPTSFLPRMRAILVDWIMEVCEVYRLRRVTYYLAVDYIDRLLTIRPTVPKHQLQLIGISSLFIAAKLEEIYPPKLTEFSYVCDGACSNEDILECEILLLNTLGWDVNPMTPTGWLNLYMQIHFKTKKPQNGDDKEKTDFFYPQYSAYQFVLASHLTDVFSLDPGFVLFNYSIIAASAMYFLFGRSVALRVSGLEWNDIKDCTEYMAVFYSIIRDAQDPRLQTVITHEADDREEAAYNALRVWIPELTVAEHHALQTHVVDLKYFEKATLLRLERMGLRVRKTFVKKKKPEIESAEEIKQLVEDVLEEVEKSAKEEEETPLVMFEIEKMAFNFNCEEKMPAELNDNDVDYFAEKSTYTFDEILIGINNCTNKTLLPRLLGQEVQVSDKNY